MRLTVENPPKEQKGHEYLPDWEAFMATLRTKTEIRPRQLWRHFIVRMGIQTLRETTDLQVYYRTVAELSSPQREFWRM